MKCLTGGPRFVREPGASLLARPAGRKTGKKEDGPLPSRLHVAPWARRLLHSARDSALEEGPCPAAKNIGKAVRGKPNARFDEGGRTAW